PGVKPWLKGLIHFRGDFLPVTDLRQFIFDIPSELHNKNRVLVIQDNDNKFGLLINEVVGIDHISEYKVEPLSLERSSFFKEFVDKELNTTKGRFPIFEVSKLLRSQRFYQISDMALI